ncbi:HtaA domain-containing protein [Streptomyces sp. I05A-00742]|uniref:HtaA domain-containing protein n=1 Tax=Streptomyces sp. I05A-00742 TaxID=2732853 RepID=UPI001488A828|nr:HtaA domain-containing protein [Streptomyces sp. I05A-00742]
MKAFTSKKRTVVLALLTATALGIIAVQAGAIGADLPISGSGTFCLSPNAEHTLAAQNVTLEAIAPATRTGNCVTLPGSGTLASDLSSGGGPFQGGMRFADSEHRLDVTNLNIHIKLGEGSTSADVAQDGAAATNVDFFHYPVALDLVSFTPTTVDTKNIPLKLAAPGAAAFTNAFGAGTTAAFDPLFLFDGHAQITNPFAGVPKP